MRAGLISPQIAEVLRVHRLAPRARKSLVGWIRGNVLRILPLVLGPRQSLTVGLARPGSALKVRKG